MIDPIQITTEEYLEHCGSYDGVCLDCGEIRFGSTEPDAEGYHCDSCEEAAVMGIETAMVCGHVVVVS